MFLVSETYDKIFVSLFRKQLMKSGVSCFETGTEKLGSIVSKQMFLANL